MLLIDVDQWLLMPRLGLAARKSMTAVDKASLHSQLLDTRPNYAGLRQEREYPHAFPESKMLSTRRSDGDFRPFPFTYVEKPVSRFDPSAESFASRSNHRESFRESSLRPQQFENEDLMIDEQRNKQNMRSPRSAGTQSGTMNYRLVDELLVEKGGALRSSSGMT